MLLEQSDLKKIRVIVKEEAVETEKRMAKKIEEVVGASEKRMTKKIEDAVTVSEERTAKKIEDEVGGLAAMTKRGFDAVDEKFEQVNQGLYRQDKKMDRALLGISHLEFIATEMVRRDEWVEVKQRLERLERKTGILR